MGGHGLPKVSQVDGNLFPLLFLLVSVLLAKLCILPLLTGTPRSGSSRGDGVQCVQRRQPAGGTPVSILLVSVLRLLFQAVLPWEVPGEQFLTSILGLGVGDGEGGAVRVLPP